MTNPLDSPQLLAHLPQYLGEFFGFWELALALWRRSGRTARAADRGSLYLIWVVIGLSVFAAFVAALNVPAADSMLLLQLVPLAIALFVLGLILRWYAVFYLGRFFTVNVAISADHRLIDTGPYRLIRHPSYTGAMLALLGLGMSYRNWLSLVLIVVPPTLALMWRISVEEKALRSGLGEAYANYQLRTRRLIPYVY
jgi:protein-S-isoprenylcysteine O-methyltransferase